jgi:hypothetical protein
MVESVQTVRKSEKDSKDVQKFCPYARVFRSSPLRLLIPRKLDLLNGLLSRKYIPQHTLCLRIKFK